MADLFGWFCGHYNGFGYFVLFDGASVSCAAKRYCCPCDIIWGLDWIGTAQIDGVVWALEVEVKFYLIAVLFSCFLLSGSSVLFAILFCLSLVGAQWGFDGLFFAKYVLFMLCSSSFYLFSRGVIRGGRFSINILVLFLIFSLFVNAELRQNYFFALLVFAAAYFFRRKLKGGRIFDFLADISYPLYVPHTAFGYVGLRWMMGMGVVAEVALFTQVVLSMALAYGIHKMIEGPTHRMGRDKMQRLLFGAKPT